MKRRLGQNKTVLCPQRKLPHPQGKGLPQNPVSLPSRQRPQSCDSRPECSSSTPMPSRYVSATPGTDCSEEGEEGLLGVSLAFFCFSTTLHGTLATWLQLQTTTVPGMGPLSTGQSRPPSVVPQQVQFLTKEVAAGTLVSQLLGQPSHLKLVANRPQPRQGFVFAKNVLGAQSVWACTCLHTPGCVHAGFLVPFCCGGGCLARDTTAPRYFLQDQLSGQPSPDSHYQ